MSRQLGGRQEERAGRFAGKRGMQVGWLMVGQGSRKVGLGVKGRCFGPEGTLLVWMRGVVCFLTGQTSGSLLVRD